MLNHSKFIKIQTNSEKEQKQQIAAMVLAISMWSTQIFIAFLNNLNNFPLLGILSD